MAAIAYFIVQHQIIAAQGENSILRKAIGSDWKGKISPLLYATAIVAAVWLPGVALAIYALVALIWLIPDRRIERILKET